MAKKKHPPAGSAAIARGKGAKPAAKAPEKRALPLKWILAAAGVVIVVAILGSLNTGTKGAGAASPEERKYIGRYLPAGYQEPKVADLMLYPETTKMTPIAAADAGTQLSIPVDKTVSGKIVSFEYAKPGGKPIPMIAYVKPSGSVFVGVSFCPPCQGEGQRIEPDGSLTCESCGTNRDVESGVGLSGTCKLYPLDEMPVKVAGGKITVEKSALDGWTAQPLDRKIGG